MKKQFYTIFLIFSIFSILIGNQRKSIHQLQAEQNKLKNIPPLNIINVKTGLDLLIEEHLDLIKGKSIALVTNHTGIDKHGIPNYKRLLDIKNIKLKKIITTKKDLYKKNIHPNKNDQFPELFHLNKDIDKIDSNVFYNINLILYDVQHLGTRFDYELKILTLLLESAGLSEIPILILDRPNPIRGDIIEGPILNLEHQFSTNSLPIPIRYGGTIGELSKLIIKEKWISKSPTLTVINNKGWNNQLWFDETDLIWISTMPNIPDLNTAILYPGIYLITSTNVSEGLGTLKPYNWIGAPWINGQNLSKALNFYNLPGVVFSPIFFTPISILNTDNKLKYDKKQCYGIEIKIINRNIFNSVNTGVIILFTLFNMYPDKFVIREDILNELWGNDELFFEILRGTSPLDFIQNN